MIGGGWSEWLWPDANPARRSWTRCFPTGRSTSSRASATPPGSTAARSRSRASTVDADPPDGVIERDPASGEPAGRCATRPCCSSRSVLPRQSSGQRLDSVRAGIDLAHSVGITSVIEPGLDAELIAPSLTLADAGELGLRVRASLSPIDWQPGAFDDGVFDFLEDREKLAATGPRRRLRQDLHGRRDRVRHGRPARALRRPALRPRPAFLHAGAGDRYFTRFDAMGLAIHVHAVGDAGIRMALDGFAAMRKANGMSDNRHHIVHLQLIDAADRPRFAAARRRRRRSSRCGPTRTPPRSSSTCR